MEGKERMTRWEYKILRFQTFKLFEARLGAYGNEGWEAISFSHDPNAPPIAENDVGVVHVDGLEGVRAVWVALLKRPLPDV